MGVPPVIIQLSNDGIFPHKNHPAIGVPLWLVWVMPSTQSSHLLCSRSLSHCTVMSRKRWQLKGLRWDLPKMGPDGLEGMIWMVSLTKFVGKPWEIKRKLCNFLRFLVVLPAGFLSGTTGSTQKSGWLPTHKKGGLKRVDKGIQNLFKNSSLPLDLARSTSKSTVRPSGPGPQV